MSLIRKFVFSLWQIHDILSFNYSFKLSRTMTKPKIAPTLHYQVQFRMKKEVHYGKGVYVCGNIAQLGRWKPAQSLRLIWHEGHIWKGSLLLSKDTIHRISQIQFKFIISTWNMNQLSGMEWQNGRNRNMKISTLQKHHIYNATWNTYKYILFLKVNEVKETDTFYILGSIPELGNWEDKKLMKKVQTSQQDHFWQDMKFNPEFMDYSQDYRIFMMEFTTNRMVQQFNYYYMSFGKRVMSQVYPGRVIKNNGMHVQKDRIMQFDWQGCKVVLDESSFNRLHIQRITSQFFIANQLNLIYDFQRLVNLKITSIYLLRHENECNQDTYTLFQNTCKCYGISLNMKKINQNILQSDHEINLQQIKMISNEIDDKIIDGNRLCLIVTNKMLEMYPINFIQLTLVVGYSFQHSLEIIKKQYCNQFDNEEIKDRDEDYLDLYEFIREKLMRGRLVNNKK